MMTVIDSLHHVLFLPSFSFFFISTTVIAFPYLKYYLKYNHQTSHAYSRPADLLQIEIWLLSE